MEDIKVEKDLSSILLIKGMRKANPPPHKRMGGRTRR
jgi:hypothetical protein